MQSLRSAFNQDGTVAQLRRENRRLRGQIDALRPKARLRLEAEQEAAVIDSFHVLYRDVRAVHKRTRWRGTRVLKCPFDLWTYQEIIAECRPDLIVETGTMYGGSAYYFASLLDLSQNGEIVTVDVQHREGRPQHPRITYLTGSSVAPATLEQLHERAAGKETVMVILDSNHDERHVAKELSLYRDLVTPGGYLVVEDSNLNGHPAQHEYGPGPMEAILTFLERNEDFEADRSREKHMVTYNPNGWLRRKCGDR